LIAYASSRICARRNDPAIAIEFKHQHVRLKASPATGNEAARARQQAPR
jgi:hypothetical protein